MIGAASVAIYAVFVVGLAMWSIGAYQRSFYSLNATTFPGVTEDSPFVCGEVAPDDDHPSGQDVYRRLLALVQANPRKSTPEFGMLALSTGELQWAEAFRDSILAEAQSGRFTEPANSVKYGQYEAAIRVYYVSQVQVKFPDLFSTDDHKLLLDWFAAVNRRALTVEWVDWLYGLAFSKQPEGPYENQENGAALLAMLEAGGLSPVELSPANQDYLARNVRGWAQRFRNTDDSYLYQPEWIRNAYLQSLRGDATSAIDLNRRLSFEWLVLQSLPDGAPFNYNQVVQRSIPSEYYLGARLLNDPRYIWLADRALRALEANGVYPGAQPGLEEPVSLTGASPVEGSCLMYGDSGLPNQKGLLAPDKVVFRDGWSPDSTYALLNLRFTGWHRYKATNAVVALYQDGPLVVEQSSAQPFSWLPQGRAAFRDKRVPRENLNGLLVPQSGMSNVLYTLTGIGSGWAQDPPHHARVETFEMLDELDVGRTMIDDWRGWTSSRSIYFFHDGPIVIIDSASKPGEETGAAVTWHVVGAGDRAGDSMWLRADSAPARVVLPADAWPHTSIQSEAGYDATTRDWALTYRSPEPGRLDLVTTFLLNDWAGSQVDSSVVRDHATSQPVGQYLHVSSPAGEISMLHNESNSQISAHGLSTSGRAVVVQTGPDGTMQVCHIGTGEFEVPAPRGVTQVADMTGKRFVQGDDWDLVDGTIRFYESMTRRAGCVILIEA